jgi:iron complex outermembrane recepter protein
MAGANGIALYQPSNEFRQPQTEDAKTLDVGWRYQGDNYVFASSLLTSLVNNFALSAAIGPGG